MLTRLTAWTRQLLGRRRIEGELDEELQFHIDQEAAANVGRGMTPADARRAAMAAFGGVTQAREAVHVLRSTWPESIWRDVRYAVRGLQRERGFTATAVVTLALGIGANTAIFSIVNALLLRELPVREPGRLVRLSVSEDRAAWSYPLWTQLEDRQDALENVFAFSTTGVDPTRGPGLDLSAGGPTDLVNGLWVSGNFFGALGVAPSIGRAIVPSDDSRGGGADGPVVVISDAFWQRRFGRVPSAIGSRLSIERIPFTIVGVTPRSFGGPIVGTSFDIALPIATMPLVARRDRLDQRTWWWLSVMGRLRPGETPHEAASALARLQPALRDATRPADMRPVDAARYLASPFLVVPAPAGPSNVRESYRQPLIALMAVVALVLLIACANVANLLLSRGERRRHEVSLRLALGASRGRLVMQFLTESLILAAAGASAGLAMAVWASRWLVAQMVDENRFASLDTSIDWRVTAFTIGLSVAVALLFGLLPALRATNTAPIDALRQRRASAGSGPSTSGSLVVMVQVALCVVLLVATGLFGRTFASLAWQPSGIDSDRVLVVNVDARRSARPQQERLALYTQLVDRVRVLPGVREASLSSVTPVSNNEWDTVIDNPAGLSLPESERRVYKNLVSSRWFATYGIPLVAGRDITPSDVIPSPAVVVVNEALVRRYFPGTNPIGRTLHEVDSPGDPMPMVTIIGVVKDAIYTSLRETPPPTMYEPGGFGFGSISVRAERSPEALIQSVTQAIVAIDRDLALTVHPLASDVRTSLARERLLAALSGLFGALALLLAGVGLYGVVSYAVGARRTELGVRLALGASSAEIVGLVVRNVALQVGVGIAIGVPASLWASHLVSALLFDVQAGDLLTLASAIVLLAAVAAAASWVPARRVTRINLATTLRSE